MWRPTFLFPEAKDEAPTHSTGRLKFLFPELEIPEPPTTEENAGPVGEGGGGKEEGFQLEFESDDEWESVEDVKFDMPDEVKREGAKRITSSQSWQGNNFHNSFSSSISACSTISLEDALKDSEDFQGDSGDLDFDMGDRWKSALKDSLDQPIFIDHERNVRKEAIHKLAKKDRRKLGKKKKRSSSGRALERSNSEPNMVPSEADVIPEPNLVPSAVDVIPVPNLVPSEIDVISA